MAREQLSDEERRAAQEELDRRAAAGTPVPPVSDADFIAGDVPTDKIQTVKVDPVPDATLDDWITELGDQPAQVEQDTSADYYDEEQKSTLHLLEEAYGSVVQINPTFVIEIATPHLIAAMSKSNVVRLVSPFDSETYPPTSEEAAQIEEWMRLARANNPFPAHPDVWTQILDQTTQLVSAKADTNKHEVSFSDAYERQLESWKREYASLVRDHQGQDLLLFTYNLAHEVMNLLLVYGLVNYVDPDTNSVRIKIPDSALVLTRLREIAQNNPFPDAPQLWADVIEEVSLRIKAEENAYPANLQEQIETAYQDFVRRHPEYADDEGSTDTSEQDNELIFENEVSDWIKIYSKYLRSPQGDDLFFLANDLGADLLAQLGIQGWIEWNQSLQSPVDGDQVPQIFQVTNEAEVQAAVAWLEQQQPFPQYPEVWPNAITELKRRLTTGINEPDASIADRLAKAKAAFTDRYYQSETNAKGESQRRSVDPEKFEFDDELEEEKSDFDFDSLDFSTPYMDARQQATLEHIGREYQYTFDDTPNLDGDIANELIMALDRRGWVMTSGNTPKDSIMVIEEDNVRKYLTATAANNPLGERNEVWQKAMVEAWRRVGLDPAPGLKETGDELDLSLPEAAYFDDRQKRTLENIAQQLKAKIETQGVQPPMIRTISNELLLALDRRTFLFIFENNNPDDFMINDEKSIRDYLHAAAANNPLPNEPQLWADTIDFTWTRLGLDPAPDLENFVQDESRGYNMLVEPIITSTTEDLESITYHITPLLEGAKEDNLLFITQWITSDLIQDLRIKGFIWEVPKSKKIVVAQAEKLQAWFDEMAANNPIPGYEQVWKDALAEVRRRIETGIDDFVEGDKEKFQAALAAWKARDPKPVHRAPAPERQAQPAAQREKSEPTPEALKDTLTQVVENFKTKLLALRALSESNSTTKDQEITALKTELRKLQDSVVTAAIRGTLSGVESGEITQSFQPLVGLTRAPETPADKARATGTAGEIKNAFSAMGHGMREGMKAQGLEKATQLLGEIKANYQRAKTVPDNSQIVEDMGYQINEFRMYTGIQLRGFSDQQFEALNPQHLVWAQTVRYNLSDLIQN